MKRFFKYLAIIVVICIGIWFWQPELCTQKAKQLYNYIAQLVEDYNNYMNSPIRKAKNYVQERKTNTPEIDSIYIHTEIEQLKYANYADILTVMQTLKNTPAFDYAVPYYLLVRDSYLDNTKSQCDSYISNTINSFENEIVPMILQNINDKLANDFEKILEIYDGFGGVKFIHDKDELMNAWNQVIYDGKYSNILDTIMKEYDIEVLDFYNNYTDLIRYPIESNYNTHSFSILTPQKIIQNYTEQQNTNNIKDVAINGGMLILDFATAGAATALHVAVIAADAGYVAYDLYTTFTADASDEEKLCINMIQAVDIQIQDYLIRGYSTYLKNQNKEYLNALFSTMEKEENNLCINDNIEPISDLKDDYYNY